MFMIDIFHISTFQVHLRCSLSVSHTPDIIIHPNPNCDNGSPRYRCELHLIPGRPDHWHDVWVDVMNGKYFMLLRTRPSSRDHPRRLRFRPSPTTDSAI